MNKKYGLDFGTTNSSIAIEDGGESKVISIDNQSLDPRVTRSMLYFFPRKLVIDPKAARNRVNAGLFRLGEIGYEGDFKHLIGQLAVEQYLNDNKDRKPGIKRTILTGRLINNYTLEVVKYANADTSYEHYEEIDYGTGRLIQSLKTGLKTSMYKGTSIFGKFFTLEDLISIYISEIKKVADLASKDNIKEIVCGRPVYFSDDPIKDKSAQDRLEQALKLSGFEKITFEFEPVAAARQFISKTYSNQKNISKLVFVFDFGGGTLDTAIIKVGNTDQVLATDGVYIGGDLLNADVMQAKLWNYFGANALFGENQMTMPAHIYDALRSWYSIPNLNNPNTMDLLERIGYKNTDPKSLERLVHLIKANLGFDIYEAIEQAKKQLSTQDEAEIIFSDGPIDIKQKITRAEFEQIIVPRVDEIRQVVQRTLKTANLEPSQIDVIVRTGGSSLIPVFEKMLVEIFGKSKIQQFETFTSIASGLALE